MLQLWEIQIWKVLALDSQHDVSQELVLAAGILSGHELRSLRVYERVHDESEDVKVVLADEHRKENQEVPG